MTGPYDYRAMAKKTPPLAPQPKEDKPEINWAQKAHEIISSIDIKQYERELLNRCVLLPLVAPTPTKIPVSKWGSDRYGPSWLGG